MAFAGPSKRMTHSRPRTIWIDVSGDALDRTEFDRRDLVLEVYTEFVGIANIFHAKAIVYRFSDARRGHLTKWLREDAEQLLNHGVKLYVLTDNDTDHQWCRQALGRVGLTDAVQLKLKPEVYQLAEPICRCPIEPTANEKLKISGMAHLDPLLQTFLRRSFYDCDSIVLQELSGGRTATVASAHARFRDSIVGPRPLPFFVKFGDVDKIRQEVANYNYYVAHYIPFSLRPQIDGDRCLYGPKKGLLVGKFVTRSEPLLDALRRGAGVQPIHSLFEETLAGWRLQAYEGRPGGEMTRTFEQELGDLFRPDQMPAGRFDLAKSMGATQRPEDIKAALASLPPRTYLRSPMHGDLHCGNVRVRGIDSILIDFQLVRDGPLVVDPACLEVSLVFSAAGDVNDGWRELVDTLYKPEYLDRPPPPANEPSKHEWLWSAVRQLRLIALGCEKSPDEYSTALLYCLLRRARFKEDDPAEQERAAYAYVIAERLIATLKTRSSSHAVT